jgi:Uma2 family endonuclease
MAQAEVREHMVAPDRKLTFEEFLEWLDEDTWAEWIDGEVIVLSPASARHQAVKLFVAMLMRLFVHARDLGTVIDAPFVVRLRAVRRGREPDVIFVARESLSRLQRTYLDGPPELAVEVVSPESRERDRVTKFAEYAAAGVAEYWLIDPDTRQAAFYRLDAGGAYQAIPPDSAGIYRSAALPGFWLRVDWLWRDPQPDIEALQELGLLGPQPDRTVVHTA